MKRIALYFRVSTEDQTTEPQRKELLEYCGRRGWKEPREYADKISGAKWTRSGLEALMADVRARKLDAVVCVKMDRLGRSLGHLAQLVAEFDAARVALIFTSQGIDTSNDNPAGRLQMHVLMAVAEFERSLIRDRTMAGLAVARANGKTLGRPAMMLTDWQEAMVVQAAAGGMTVAALAEKLNCSVGKAHGLLKARREA